MSAPASAASPISIPDLMLQAIAAYNADVEAKADASRREDQAAQQAARDLLCKRLIACRFTPDSTTFVIEPNPEASGRAHNLSPKYDARWLHSGYWFCSLDGKAPYVLPACLVCTAPVMVAPAAIDDTLTHDEVLVRLGGLVALCDRDVRCAACKATLTAAQQQAAQAQAEAEAKAQALTAAQTYAGLLWCSPGGDIVPHLVMFAEGQDTTRAKALCGTASADPWPRWTPENVKRHIKICDRCMATLNRTEQRAAGPYYLEDFA